MSFDLASIRRSKQERPPRIILLGTPKIGKSTFAAQAPGDVFLPVRGEEGIDDLDVPAFPTVNSFANLIEALNSLHKGEHEYQFLAIDSTSTVEPLIWEQVCQDHNASTIEKVEKGYGKGFTIALDYWRTFQHGLDRLRNDRGMGCILIGHVKSKSFSDPLADTYDAWQWNINQLAAGQLTQWADSVLFAWQAPLTRSKETSSGKERTTAVRGIDRRILCTQQRPGHPGGGRGPYGELPYELPLDWNAYMTAVAEAAANPKKR